MNGEKAAGSFTNASNFSGAIFFYCAEAYHHLSICIAEGLQELGIPFYSNINYWKISPEREDYLFRYDADVSPDDCSVVVVSHQWFNQNLLLPENLFHPDRKYIAVYLDDMDGPVVWNPEFRNFDLIFRTHYNQNGEYPSNCLPWQFGLSNRILKETTQVPSFQERSKHLLVNFRNDQDVLEIANCWLKVNQGFLRVDRGAVIVDRSLRQIVREQFLPLVQKILPVEDTVDYFDLPPSDSYHYLQWTQTGQRHYPNYYKRLKESAACACFGGYAAPIGTTRKSLVEWWDSWRFWESLAAGCVTFHADFDKYGIQLPVMPENWRHYIGLDLDNFEEAVDRIASEPGILERISTSGREWAIANYGPVPTALRFLETISGRLSPGHSLPLSLPLREINLIIFPDWSEPEEALSLQLERVIRAIVTHPDKSRMTLLVETSAISEEDANLLLSSVTMNLLMEEDLDVTEGPEIALVDRLDEKQWAALLPRIQARIILERENQQAIARSAIQMISAVSIESARNQRFA